jgi:hypothetical protein
MKDVGKFYRPIGLFYNHFVYFMAIWYILWPFGPFCYAVLKKSGNPVVKLLRFCRSNRWLLCTYVHSYAK